MTESPQLFSITAIDPRSLPHSITIKGEQGQDLVTIQSTGELEYGTNYTPDEAAKAFWTAVSGFAPTRRCECDR
ncbi:hypothetical protein ACWGB8_02085 [Kitasatospora sp. NPDC054939]